MHAHCSVYKKTQNRKQYTQKLQHKTSLYIENSSLNNERRTHYIYPVQP